METSRTYLVPNIPHLSLLQMELQWHYGAFSSNKQQTLSQLTIKIN